MQARPGKPQVVAQTTYREVFNFARREAGASYLGQARLSYADRIV